MELSGIAKPYVNALLSLSTDEASRSSWSNFLASTLMLTKNTLVKQLVRSPKIGKEDKKRVLLSLLEKTLAIKISSQQSNFIGLLIDNNRVSALVAIYQLFNQLGKSSNVRVFDVCSAYEFSNKDIDTLKAGLSAKYGDHISLNTSVDSHLLGGIVVKEGDKVLDGSMKEKLEKLAVCLSHNQ